MQCRFSVAYTVIKVSLKRIALSFHVVFLLVTTINIVIWARQLQAKRIPLLLPH
jgi:hypothetical protein